MNKSPVVVIKTGVLPGSHSTSAYYAIGADTDPSSISIYCSINGPLPVKPRQELEDRATIKVIWKTSSTSTFETTFLSFSGAKRFETDIDDKETKAESISNGMSNNTVLYKSAQDYEFFIQGILSDSLLTMLFPRSGFLFTFFLSKAGDESTFHDIMACAINCLSVALIDSGNCY